MANEGTTPFLCLEVKMKQKQQLFQNFPRLSRIESCQLYNAKNRPPRPRNPTLCPYLVQAVLASVGRLKMLRGEFVVRVVVVACLQR